MKRSHVISLKNTASRFSGFLRTVGDDRVSVYAAQASYFIIISSVPFLILVLSLTKYFVDTEWLINLVENRISGGPGELIKKVIGEIISMGNVPVLSLTVVTTLWTASRGVNSVTRGIGDIYGIRYHENFLIGIVRALIYTVMFVLIIVLSIILLMFADTIANTVGKNSLILSPIIGGIKAFSGVCFAFILTIFFALLFNTVSKRGKRLSKENYESLSDQLPRGFKYQLPGAAFAAVGWVLFSYFYSLYLAYFPTGYYLYGSLAAALLLMLWMYTCMNILLIGAEINKQIFRKKMFGKRKVINK